MKRLAAGIVLFLVSFSIPAPGSANLVFFSQGLGKSLNSIEQAPAGISGPTSSLPSITAPTAVARTAIHAAPQQFSVSERSDSRFTHWSIWPGFVFQDDPAKAGSGADRAPTIPEFAEWLLVLAGFALSGVAIRNRSNSRHDDRNPSFSRLPLDI